LWGLGHPYFVTLKQPFAHDGNLRETEQFQRLILAFLGQFEHLTQAVIEQWFPKATIDQSRLTLVTQTITQVLKNNDIYSNLTPVILNCCFP